MNARLNARLAGVALGAMLVGVLGFGGVASAAPAPDSPSSEQVATTLSNELPGSSEVSDDKDRGYKPPVFCEPDEYEPEPVEPAGGGNETIVADGKKKGGDQERCIKHVPVFTFETTCDSITMHGTNPNHKRKVPALFVYKVKIDGEKLVEKRKWVWLEPGYDDTQVFDDLPRGTYSIWVGSGPKHAKGVVTYGELKHFKVKDCTEPTPKPTVTPTVEPSETPAPGSGGGLPVTGDGNTGGILATAGILLIIGIGLFAATRRRRVRFTSQGA